MHKTVEIASRGILNEGETRMVFNVGRVEAQYGSFYGMISRVRYAIRCTVRRFPRVVSSVDIGVVKNGVRRVQRSFSTTLSRPVLVGFALETTTFSEGDVVRGLIRMPDGAVNINIDNISVSVVQKEVVSVERNTREHRRVIASVEAVRGIGSDGEIIPFNVVLPRKCLSESFHSGLVSLQYSVRVVIGGDEENVTDIGINVVGKVSGSTMSGLLDWLDEMDKLEVIEGNNREEYGVVSRGTEVLESDVSEGHDNSETKNLESLHSHIMKVEF